MTHKNLFLLLSFIMLFGAVSAQKAIVLSKNSNYSVVIPDNADEHQQKAAKELHNYMRYILDNNMRIVKSSEHKGGKAIFIGNMPQTQSLYSQYENQIQDDGFLLHTGNKSFYIIGNTSKSELYGVYHLLENYFQCVCLIPDEIVFPKNLEKAVLPLHDLQNPSFAYREVLSIYPNTSQDYADWHKLHNRVDMRINWGLFVHTFQILVSAETYFDAHPEWFSEINGKRIKDSQLCLTNEEVLNTLCTNLKHMMNREPDRKIWSVSQNDNENSCTCAECLRSDSMYGGKAGTLLNFVNKVARRFPDKTISTLAYLQTRRPPENIIPEKNVNIMFCSIECQRQIPIAENPSEKRFVEDLQGWTKLTHNIFLWDYVVQFKHFLNPFPNLHVLQPNLKLFRDYHIPMVFEQGCSDLRTENSEWRTFLLSHLLWNADVDVDSLRNVFLSLYYGGNRAPIIAEYFDTMTAELLKSGMVLNIYGYPIDAVKGYLSPENINLYYSLFEKAYNTQPFEYKLVGRSLEIYNERLRRLEMALDFAVLDISTMNVSPKLSFVDSDKKVNAAMMKKLDNFTDDCKKYGITHLNESGYRPHEFYGNIKHQVEKQTKPNLALNKNVNCLTDWSEQYNPGAPQCLTDGIVGNSDYRSRWLGFQGENFEAVIDLDSVVDINEICVDFFFYPLSWIFAPESVKFWVSEDGENWIEAGVVAHENAEKLTRTEIIPFRVSDLDVKGRYVWIFGESLLTNPKWHRGHGQPCWIFVDEVIVR